MSFQDFGDQELIHYPVQLVQSRQPVARDAPLTICQIREFPARFHQKLPIQVIRQTKFSDKITDDSTNAS
jgi:hypothetical protein